MIFGLLLIIVLSAFVPVFGLHHCWSDAFIQISSHLQPVLIKLKKEEACIQTAVNIWIISTHFEQPKFILTYTLKKLLSLLAVLSVLSLSHCILFLSISSTRMLWATLNWRFLFASKSKRPRLSCSRNESSSPTLISQQTRSKEKKGDKKTLEWGKNIHRAREWRPAINWKIETFRGKFEKLRSKGTCLAEGWKGHLFSCF